jgi:hypothetical protein
LNPSLFGKDHSRWEQALNGLDIVAQKEIASLEEEVDRKEWMKLIDARDTPMA